MLTKEKFCLFLRELVELKKLENEINGLTEKWGFEFRSERYEDLIYKTLTEAMGDSQAILGWWIYETDCGKKPLGFYMHNKEIPVKTPEQLYEAMKKFYK